MKKAVVLLLSFLLVTAIFLQYIPRVPQVAAQGYLTVTASANPTSGSAPLTVQFSVVVSGGTPPYKYLWHFSDPFDSNSTEQNPTHTFISSGGDQFAYVVVMDSDDSSGFSNYVWITFTQSTTATTESPTTTPTETPTIAPTETPTTTPTTANEGITLTGMQGNVVVERNGVAVTTSSLQPGDQVTTGDGSSASITFADGSKVDLGPNTTLELSSIGGIQSLITLLFGKIHAFSLLDFKLELQLPCVLIAGPNLLWK